MKIAVNYTNETVKLLNEGRLDIDYIKYPSLNNTDINELKEIRSKVKDRNVNVLFHGCVSKSLKVRNIVSREFKEDLDLEKFKEALSISNTKVISIHLGFSSKDKRTPSEIEDLENIILENIKYLKDNFKGYVIEIENKEKSKIIDLIDPSFISKIINEADVKLLLDICHAARAARILNMSLKDYIDMLPLNKVEEVHTSGWIFKNDITDEYDSHIMMQKDNYDILQYVLERTTPKIITLEYAGLYNKKTNTVRWLTKKDNIDENVENEILEQVKIIRDMISKRK